ncbi:MAG: hypothetical protein I8H77_12120 [Comamonadaceae bacterium]|nr:hypothetical protein [Comamonadaceae bacterium]
MSEPSPTKDQPLGLTVHSLPTPSEAGAQNARSTRRGRWTMLALALVCAMPVIASYFSYYVVRPEGRRNFGELIDPQRLVPTMAATNVAGQPVDLATLKGQWLLVSVSGGACDNTCQQHLYVQRQLRESLGREKDRLDWVWLVTDDVPLTPELRPVADVATVLRVPSAELAKWLVPAAGHQASEHLYVVDPMGHWMMRFPANMDMAGAAKAKRDLERLLRASVSWDNAGR